MLVPAPASASGVSHTVVLFKGHTDEFMVYGLAQWRTERGGLGCSNPPPKF